MRILVADQNALLLAAITATFGPHCDLVTATRRDVCLAQLEQNKFDVVIAGDKLSDYTGLELLSEVPVISPDTLLVFAADPKRLQQLGKRLAVFGLFEAISYPLTPQKLVDVLRRAREKLQASRQPKIRHVVLESEWDTGERLGLIEREAQEADGADDFVFAGPPTVRAASSSAERILEGTPVVCAAGVPDDAAAPDRAATGRTFEGTQVGSSADSEAVVTEYEVKPSLPALPHSPTHASSAIEGESEDEFVFATEVEPASGSAAQDIAPEVVEDDVQEAATTDEEFDEELEFLCSNDAVFEVPEPPKWAADGAANDTAFEGKAPLIERQSGASESGSSRARAPAELPAPPPAATPAPTAAPSSSKSAQQSKAAVSSQPRVRAQTVPTEAQRAAFERALARRNFGEGQGATAESQSSPKAVRAKPTIQLGSTAGVFTGLSMSGQPSASLSELAKRATSKRPLAEPKVGKAGKVAPNRAVFVVGSGVAAVLVLGVLSFDLLRHSGEAEHHMPHAQALSTQVFSPSTTLVASSGGEPAQLVPSNDGGGPAQPAAPESQDGGLPPQDMPPILPRAQSFDADTAPEDPPPPPVLEHPGPSEPPSAPTMGNTDVPPWAISQQQAWGTTSSDSPNQ
jgi:CheY-like chemotaxis protein